MSTKRYGYCYNNKGILRFSWVIINYFAHFFLEQGWIFNFVMEFAAHQSYFFGETRLWMWIFKKSSRKGRRKEIEDEQRNLFKRIPREIPFLHQILLQNVQFVSKFLSKVVRLSRVQNPDSFFSKRSYFSFIITNKLPKNPFTVFVIFIINIQEKFQTMYNFLQKTSPETTSLSIYIPS